jgi:hypothetical protein
MDKLQLTTRPATAAAPRSGGAARHWAGWASGRAGWGIGGLGPAPDEAAAADAENTG